MDADQLRAMQAPLKERYREDAGAALITLSADGSLDGEGITCSVATGRALVFDGFYKVIRASGSLLLKKNRKG